MEQSFGTILERMGGLEKYFCVATVVVVVLSTLFTLGILFPSPYNDGQRTISEVRATRIFIKGWQDNQLNENGVSQKTAPSK